MRNRKWLVLVALLIGVLATALSIVGPELLRFHRLGTVHDESVYPWVWPVEVPAGWPEPTESARKIGFSYEQVTSLNREDSTKILQGWRLRMGWPLSVVEGGGFAVIPLPPTVRGPSTTNAIWTAHLGRGTMLFPYRPLPWALAGNIFIYTAIAYGIGAAIAAWRFRRLRDADRCTVCAYPLGGASVCPECGAAEA